MDRVSKQVSPTTTTERADFARSQVSTGAEVSSFNSQPQAYSLSLFRGRLRLTVKPGL
jgi:hypothetical protein